MVQYNHNKGENPKQKHKTLSGVSESDSGPKPNTGGDNQLQNKKQDLPLSEQKKESGVDWDSRKPAQDQRW